MIVRKVIVKKELTAETLNKEIFEDVLFFSLAEGGACGVPGEMVVINKEPAAYAMQSVFGDVDVREVEKLFPVLPECEFGLFGLNSKVPKGWNYVSLGLGNHLIVADEVYDQFKSLTEDCKEDYEYYAVWQDVARVIAGLPEFTGDNEYI